jgi:hypothetical protein
MPVLPPHCPDFSVPKAARQATVEDLRSFYAMKSIVARSPASRYLTSTIACSHPRRLSDRKQNSRVRQITNSKSVWAPDLYCTVRIVGFARYQPMEGNSVHLVGMVHRADTLNGTRRVVQRCCAEARHIKPPRRLSGELLARSPSDLDGPGRSTTTGARRSTVRRKFLQI